MQALAQGETVYDTFQVQVTDEHGATDTETVTVTVTGTNDAPTVAAPVAGAGNEGSGSFNVGLLQNVSDVDNGAVLHVENLVWDEVPGNLPAGFTWNGNSISVDTSSLAYDQMAAGEPFVTHFTFQVVDEHGSPVTQHATITITGTNDGPVAVTDSNAGDAVAESGVNPGNTPFAGDASATGNVLTNDTDVDAAAMSKTVVGVTTGTAALLQRRCWTVTGPRTLNVAANGAWTYSLDNADPDTNAAERRAGSFRRVHLHYGR